MQIQVPQNAYALSAGHTMAQGLRSSAGQDIQTTTFECADLAYGFEVEHLSEKTSSTNNFSPATRELFGLDEVDLNNCATMLPSPTAPSQPPPTPDLIADCLDPASPIGPEPPLTPEPEINAADFVSGGGKSIWPGKRGADPGAEESEDDGEDKDNDGSGESEYGADLVAQAAANFVGKSVRKSIPGFSGKSVSKTIHSYISDSICDQDQETDEDEEDEDCEHEPDNEDGRASDLDFEYEDGESDNSDNESETESVKALPRGGKTIIYHAKTQDDERQACDDESVEQPA